VARETQGKMRKGVFQNDVMQWQKQRPNSKWTLQWTKYLLHVWAIKNVHYGKTHPYHRPKLKKNKQKHLSILYLISLSYKAIIKKKNKTTLETIQNSESW
jgi:hypothetical protein